jgi:hypothetical protein
MNSTMPHLLRLVYIYVPAAACRSVFDLLVELPDKKATTLRITLPAHFPQVCMHSQG